jgi:hypothetical protein
MILRTASGLSAGWESQRNDNPPKPLVFRIEFTLARAAQKPRTHIVERC